MKMLRESPWLKGVGGLSGEAVWHGAQREAAVPFHSD